jgi:hypothetical protein
MDLRKDMGEHGLAGRALADCLCGPRYGRLDRGPGVEIAGGRLPDVGWDGHWWDCVLREEMKEAQLTFCAWLGDSRACRLIDYA